MREVWAGENAPGRDPQLLPRRVRMHFVADGNVDRRPRVLTPAPHLLQRLLVEDSVEGRHYRNNIRRYNNTLAFAAFSTDLKHTALARSGTECVHCSWAGILDNKTMREVWAGENAPGRDPQLLPRRNNARSVGWRKRSRQRSSVASKESENAFCRRRKCGQEYCRARHFKCEETSPNHFSTCCNNGLMAVSGPRVLTPAPHLLQRLLVEDSVEGRHYRNNIRRYNNTLAFAAFSTDLNTRRLPGRGPNVFTVHGQGYWTISNDLIGNDPIQRRFCQLYFVESGEANRIRRDQQQLLPAAHRLLPSVLEDLDGLLRDINPFAQAFETMREVWAGENAPGRDPQLLPRRVRMHFVADGNVDRISTCCNNGLMAVSGPRVLTPAPHLLQRLLVEDSVEGRHYRNNIRRYNNTLAFAAFSTDLNTRRLPGRGPNVFTVHGQGYWTISNDLIGNDPIQRRFCQLYFVESGEANRIRRDQQQLLPAAHRLLPSVLEDLDGLLRDINPFAQAFETMREVWAGENAPGRDPQLLPRRVRMHFVADGNVDRISTCCNNGLMAVSGPRVLTPAPHLLQRLLVEDSVEGRHYRNNIRRYNNTLAFAAFSTDLNTRRLPGRGPNVFTVHGQGYWTISNDLIGNDPIQRRFCQLYFVESGEANRIRRDQQQLLPAAHRLLPSVLEDLDGLLRDINPFAQAFETMREVWAGENAPGRDPQLLPRRVRMHFVADGNVDRISTCCNNGLMAVSGPRVLTPAPHLLQRLLVEDSVEGRHYRNNIRRYNNTLAFAAFSTDLNTRRLPGRGPNVFTVHGQGYWTISNDLIGNDPIQRRFCQLYFVESGEANRIRRDQQQLLPAAHRLLPSVLEDLDGLLRDINPFAQAFETMREVWAGENAPGRDPQLLPRRVRMHFVADGNVDRISTCCNNGLMAVSGPRVLTPAPHLLQRLLVEDSVEGRHYRNNIRRYNNTLAFAAFSTDLNTRRLPGRGPNVFTVHGQGYWTISNDLIGNDPIQRRFCQLYFVESGEANRIRRDQQQLLPAAHRLLPSVLEDLDGLLRDINPFAQAFETMREVWAGENAPGRDPQLLPRRVRMHFVADGNVDRISTCCNNGLMAVSGPRVLTPAPHLLQRLLVEDSVEGRHYRNNIRRYNNTLAFAAFSTDLNTRRLPGRGPNVFTVHGQGYWTISNDLIGNDPIQRRFCQLYFVESGEANRIRRDQQQLLPAAHRLLPSVLEDLDGLLRDINPFAQAFETMREVWAGENAPGRDPQLLPRRVRMHFVADGNVDRISTCCNNGLMAVSGPRVLTPAPHLLQRLLVEDSVEGRHYRNNIRRYNNTLAFAAFSTDLNTRRLPGRGPNVFTVHGQGYWTISNDLIGNDPIQRRFCQLYFVESGEANRIRRDQQQLLPAAHRLLPSVLEDLDGLLRDINPFAQAFETMREVWAGENAPGRDPQLLPRRVRMHFVADGNVDRISTCCNNGLMAVSGPRVLTPAPHLLQRLLVEDSVEGRHYRNNIRRYNNTLAFAAFSTDLNTRRLPGRGPNVFTVHGQGYWTISNDLIGNDPIQRRFCQLYFVESGEANRIRRDQQQLLPAAHRLLPSVLEDLDGLLRDINPFAQAFETMREVWAGENAPGRDPQLLPRRVRMHFVADGNVDRSIVGPATLRPRVLTPAPHLLQRLLVEDSVEGRHYRNNIRRYNNTLAFAAFSTDLKHTALARSGTECVHCSWAGILDNK
ncbi:LOW QUALITY PROTEIN: uncharacterized protein LOC132947381 [Metopolophium dirhodum]|uniref:LOW QUALITY PROTEIN: uncharacterized protein LOC132947381 n=1 Tax=Metopolophium dirhodum TaxID=44670 RepID=UPI00298FF3D0|nr:LOW QUALITY PROTEIN: uncharacterized protein LOC132947381 [Metopolophium dirhodum]